MTTLNLIPQELFDIAKFDEFTAWLLSIPIDLYTTRQTARRWAAAVSYKLKREDWERIETQWIKKNANS